MYLIVVTQKMQIEIINVEFPFRFKKIASCCLFVDKAYYGCFRISVRLQVKRKVVDL